MSMKLGERQLNELRPEPCESLVIHTHIKEGNVGWILVNGKYLANQEVESLEQIAKKLREAKENIGIGIMFMGNLNERDKYEVILEFINSILGVSEEAKP